jgi:hypothetical protein
MGSVDQTVQQVYASQTQSFNDDNQNDHPDKCAGGSFSDAAKEVAPRNFLLNQLKEVFKIFLFVFPD